MDLRSGMPNIYCGKSWNKQIEFGAGTFINQPVIRMFTNYLRSHLLSKGKCAWVKSNDGGKAINYL
jgi:hypothetical protein